MPNTAQDVRGEYGGPDSHRYSRRDAKCRIAEIFGRSLPPLAAEVFGEAAPEDIGLDVWAISRPNLPCEGRNRDQNTHHHMTSMIKKWIEHQGGQSVARGGLARAIEEGRRERQNGDRVLPFWPGNEAEIFG